MSTSHWPASLLKKIADKLLDEIVDWKKAAALLSTGLLAFATAALTWLRGSFVLRGWWLAAILAYVVILTVIAMIYLQQAVRRSRKFREIRVEEAGVGLEWRLRLDPEDWVHTRLQDYSPRFLLDILSGPFHLPDKGECSAEVGFVMDSDGRTGYRPSAAGANPMSTGNVFQTSIRSRKPHAWPLQEKYNGSSEPARARASASAECLPSVLPDRPAASWHERCPVQC